MARMNRAALVVVWSCFLAMVFFYFVEIVNGGNPWKTGDWLINYQGGPVRRGLAGEILFQLSRFGVPLGWITFGVQTAIYFLVFYLVQKLYLIRDRGAEWLAVLLSPAFLLFPFHDFAGGFRKEILVFLPFALLVYFFVKKRLTGAAVLLCLLLYLLAVFSHELAVFVVPFFAYLFASAVRTRRITPAVGALSTAAFLGAALLGLSFAVIFPGSDATAAGICSSLSGMRFSPGICDGAIQWLRYDAGFGLNAVKASLPAYAALYPPLAVLSLLPVLCSGWARENAAFLSVAGLFCMPLFIFAVDWGRWIHVYVFFVYVLVLAESAQGGIRIRGFRPSVLAVYLTTWSIPHFTKGGYDFRFGLIEKLCRESCWVVELLRQVPGWF